MNFLMGSVFLERVWYDDAFGTNAGILISLLLARYGRKLSKGWYLMVKK